MDGIHVVESWLVDLRILTENYSFSIRSLKLLRLGIPIDVYTMLSGYDEYDSPGPIGVGE